MTVTKGSKIVLYTHEVSPYGDRVTAILKEANLDFENILLNPFDPPVWFKDINPMGKVPAMKIDDHCLAESWVMLEYINDRYLESKLMPNDHMKQAQIRFISAYIAEKSIAWLRECETNFHDEKARTTFKQRIAELFHKLNCVLLEQAPTGPYFLGQEFSLADICIAPFLVRLETFGKVCLGGFTQEIFRECPRLFEFYQGATSRPSIKEAFIGEKAFMDFQDSYFHLYEKL